jgi:gliding motility-associated-like protein
LTADVLTNDTGLSDGGIVVSLLANVTNGVLELNSDGSYTYTPNPDYYGYDGFGYIVCDIDDDCDSAVVEIEVIDDNELSIPEAFSPNDDGYNDVFFIEGLDLYPNNSLFIFNRWGNKVFEASPYNNDWDGSNNFGLAPGGNKLPEGTYFYILKTDDNEKGMKGYVYLKR